MAEETRHLLSVIGANQQTLKNENLRLKKELEISKKMLIRMDRSREGLVRMSNLLRANWKPENENDLEQKELKENPEKFKQAMLDSMTKVINDVPYCERRSQDFESAIRREADASLNESSVFKEEVVPEGVQSSPVVRRNGKII